MASTMDIVLGTIAFMVFWFLAVFPSIPFLPIGRTAGSLLGAMLMVIFQVITTSEAYASIDLSILGLLFGTMVVVIYLERASMFKYLGKLLSWKSQGPKDLLIRISLITAISSALFTNDTSCIALTEFILEISRQHNLSPLPFLLALASSANIGSAATPIGNPQNLVIAIESRINFTDFLLGILPATIIGIIVNTLLLLVMYWKDLKGTQNRVDEEVATSSVISREEAEEILNTHRFSPVHMSNLSSPVSYEFSSRTLMNIRSLPYLRGVIGGSRFDRPRNNRFILSENDVLKVVRSWIEDWQRNPGSGLRLDSVYEEPPINEPLLQKGRENEASVLGPVEGEETGSRSDRSWTVMIWKSCVYIITFGMLVGLLIGLDMSWTTITAALALVVLDFTDAGPSLEKVSYLLLLFFCGMFIVVEGFQATGIPGAMWNITEPYARITTPIGIGVLSLVILVLSNLVSNVPTVLLLGAKVAESAAAISSTEEKKAWLILAWVSTVAGNFTLLGSAANLIVCEQARRSSLKYDLSFWKHLAFGVPSTLIVTAIGLTLIRG